jgi:hypothetical protein
LTIPPCLRILRTWRFMKSVRHGSNGLNCSQPTKRHSFVMLSAAKHLCAERDRPFAEFTLSATNGLRVTRCNCSNRQVQFVKIEPCHRILIAWGKSFHFLPAETINGMVVDHADCLHEGVTDGRTGKSKTQFLQLFAQCI